MAAVGQIAAELANSPKIKDFLTMLCFLLLRTLYAQSTSRAARKRAVNAAHNNRLRHVPPCGACRTGPGENAQTEHQTGCFAHPIMNVLNFADCHILRKFTTGLPC
ncbi:MAG: hypothetical protein KGL56_02020, partial [Alphaproteobacteria bacterium]|nr:hypothetical protein [Alphaproteobacteria bacterium]